MNEGSKTCRKCGRTKPLTEFAKNSGHKDGRLNKCKSCAREYNRAYRAANPDRAAEDSRRWREQNPDATAENNARWYAENGAMRRAQMRSIRAADPMPGRKAIRLWRARNPLAVTEQGARRRAAKRGAVFGRVDYRALRATNDCCYLCGDGLSGRISYDHMVPLARGGSHSTENLRPVHERCNLRKHAAYLWDFPGYVGPTLLGAWTVRPVTCQLAA